MIVLNKEEEASGPLRLLKLVQSYAKIVSYTIVYMEESGGLTQA